MYTDSTDQDNSARLIARCKEGQGKAQSELYRLYSKRMMSVSFRIVNDRAVAEDILQEAFLTAFQEIRSFDEKKSFGTWLRRFVINLSLNELKKNKLLLVPIGDFDTIEEHQEEESLDFNLNVHSIVQCIHQLPLSYRTFLSLFFVEGMSHASLAKLFNISEHASRTRCKRGRKMLCELLKQKDLTAK
jgi:RNA polymerase sigma factor (sigma-70 family)